MKAICNTCGVEKYLSEFYKNPQRFILMKACKICTDQAREYRKTKSNTFEEREKQKYNALLQKKQNGIYDLNIFKTSMRGLITTAFKRKSIRKDCKSEMLIGVPFLTAKLHIETMFKEGMTWENHGLWHIDHIIPLKYAKTKEDVIVLCHYRNLQPLWAADNLTKGSKIIPFQLYLNI